jgi:hypothetical protein
MTTAFSVLVLLPSMAFAFLVLSTFYGARRAYLALCWIPVALFAVIYVFRQLLAFDPSQGFWMGDVLEAVRLASLVQGCLGVVLAVRTYRRRQSLIELIPATCLAVLPFFLRM